MNKKQIRKLTEFSDLERMSDKDYRLTGLIRIEAYASISREALMKDRFNPVIKAQDKLLDTLAGCINDEDTNNEILYYLSSAIKELEIGDIGMLTPRMNAVHYIRKAEKLIQ